MGRKYTNNLSRTIRIDKDLDKQIKEYIEGESFNYSQFVVRCIEEYFDRDKRSITRDDLDFLKADIVADNEKLLSNLTQQISKIPVPVLPEPETEKKGFFGKLFS